MSEKSHTTQNGHEINNPSEVLSYYEFRDIVENYGMSGSSPEERIDSLRNSSKENIALFLTDINRRLNGSGETLVSRDVIKVGDKPMIAPENRYDLFSTIIQKIQDSPKELSPGRLGDALALTTTMLHPFADCNGRTARLVGFMYRSDFDSESARDDFETLAASRDEIRDKGGFMVNGYIPRLGEADQSDAQVVSSYIDRVLTDNTDLDIYTGPYGRADLYELEE